MHVFVTAVTVALVVSFLCSIFESVLLSISHAQVEVLVSKGRRSGKILKAFKERIDIPISAILITNTAAHTIGTAVAGASYASAFDAESLWLFTVVFTIAVLLFTEIIPKTLGVAFAAQLLHAFEVVDGRRVDAALALHRFEQYGGHGLVQRGRQFVEVVPHHVAEALR